MVGSRHLFQAGKRSGVARQGSCQTDLALVEPDARLRMDRMTAEAALATVARSGSI
jgi:hypothetical protein